MGILKYLRRRKNAWGDRILEAVVRDWSLETGQDPADTPESVKTPYRVAIEASKTRQQYVVSAASERNPEFGCELFFEVNRGVPCLHVTNRIGGDNVLHILFEESGIVVIPENDRDRPLPVLTDRYYPGSSGFSALYHNPVDDAA